MIILDDNGAAGSRDMSATLIIIALGLGVLFG